MPFTILVIDDEPEILEMATFDPVEFLKVVASILAETVGRSRRRDDRSPASG